LKEEIIDYNVDDIISDMTDVEVVEDQQKDFDDIERMAGQSPIIKFVNYLISNAISEGASDIHIEPKDKNSRVRYRIDGVLFDSMQSPAKMHPAVVSRIKIMSNLDISERRLPQDGKISVIVGGRAIDLRISILPTNRGEKVVIRILDSKSVMKGLEHLGMESNIQQSFQEQIALPNGIFLVTGPTGSGKSTTLYSALCQMDGDKLNISTVEDPVEYELDFCNQVQVNEKIGLDFASALRSLLRQDPDIIMIGEIRDQETAKIAVQAALTGHLVFSTLHTNDAASSITRLIDIGIDAYLISASLNGILAQRLVRRICPECKEPYKVSESMRKYAAEVGVGADELFHGKGCDNCRGSGYVGRIGIYEMLVVDDVFRDMINKDASVSNMRKVFRQKNHLNLFDDGIIKVRRGLTTIEEVLRVTEMQSKDQNDTPKESADSAAAQSVNMNIEYEADENEETEPSEQPEEIQSEPVSVTLEKWQHIEGRQGASQYGEEHAWVKEAVSDDFVFTLRARLNEGQGYGIWFRADPEKLDGYCFQYDTSHTGGSLVLNKWENFNQQTIISVPWDKSWYEQMREIEIRAVGADISITVDGQEIINLTDKQYRSGRIGFRLWDKSKADFEDTSLAAV
jgi:type IV pilus assembly protein PilB